MCQKWPPVHFQTKKIGCQDIKDLTCTLHVCYDLAVYVLKNLTWPCLRDLSQLILDLPLAL